MVTIVSPTALSVTLPKKRCVRGLGRGPRSENRCQFPKKNHSLKILQCNINGVTTAATKVKLDQLLELAESNEVQSIQRKRNSKILLD
ncbi:hypothetical protein TNCV_1249531 [Trichonephila clavipes]|nr:hypothetical protein TNCV_1249531 [Trichonephila clavipes]